jgi:predicted ATPase
VQSIREAVVALVAHPQGGRHGGNLPAEISSFVGRTRECAELATALADHRLVTVTGIGGVGKTRTALRVAAEQSGRFADGVWLVELSGLQDSQLLANAVADALGIQDQTLRPQVDVLADYLAEREPLLILDTCEHLLDGCALLSAVLLAAAPKLRIMATSRRPLDIDGEHVYPVLPLPVPEAHTADTSDAMTLFAERARAVDPGFALTGGTGAAVAQLCRRLDGIPLAIELAAVWLRSLTIEQVAERLDERFKLLAGGDTALGRHETLRTAIGWSHELLRSDERLLWARLAVFPGGFDAASAARVCADDQLPEDDIAVLLEGLVERSILLRDPCEGGGPDFEAPRYRLLDTIREYGEEWLVQLGEQDRLRRRHRDRYLWLARRYEAEWCGPDQVPWCDRLKCEHANLRAALDYCLADPAEHRVGLDLVGTLYLFWVPGGFIREGRHYFDRLLAADPPPGRELTKALWTCARLAATQGDFAAVDERLAACRTYAAEQGDRVAEASVVYIAGSCAMLRGDHETAVPLLEQATELHQNGGDPGTGLIFAYALHSMARVMRGEVERAVELSEQCRAVADRYGEGWARSFGDYMRALAEMRRGDPAAAQRYGRESLAFKSRLGDNFGSALALDLLATAATAGGDPARGARLLGFAERVWATFGLPQAGSPDLAAARRRTEDLARGALGDEPYETAVRSGRELPMDEGFAYALGET